MLNIGKSYIEKKDGNSRLCADLTIGNRRTTMWFGIESEHEDWLSLGRADPFVMAMLPAAMREGYEIVCEDPMSERLHYQFTNELIPTLAFSGELYHKIKISSPFTSKRVNNQGAVGTGFSGGVDSLYTIMRHGRESALPLTHIAVINREARLWDNQTFQKLCRRAALFGKEQGLVPVFIDTNYRKIVPSKIDNLPTYRYLAAVYAMAGLFKTYLVSSGPNASKFNLDLQLCDRYDLLTVNCASTESLTLYLSGVETTRRGKLEALSEWEPSRRWINPCLFKEGEYQNCGHCKKCIHDMTMLYAMGKLDRYNTVFDTDDYYKFLPARIGYVMAGREESESFALAYRLLKENQAYIPPASYIFEKQFRRAKQNHKNIIEAEIEEEETRSSNRLIAEGGKRQ